MAKNKTEKTEKLKVMLLGGLNEIGKNLAVLEYGADMVLVAVGEEDAAHAVHIFFKISDVGDDEIDAQHILVGEA